MCSASVGDGCGMVRNCSLPAGTAENFLCPYCPLIFHRATFAALCFRETFNFGRSVVLCISSPLFSPIRFLFCSPFPARLLSLASNPNLLSADLSLSENSRRIGDFFFTEIIRQFLILRSLKTKEKSSRELRGANARIANAPRQDF